MAFVKHTKSESFEVVRDEGDPKEAFKEAKKREEDARLAEQAATAPPDKQA